MPFKPTGFLFFLFVLCCTKISAQNISGVITDTINKKNIANAVVAVLTPADSILYKFTRTGKDGSFVIKDIKPGNYILMVTHPYFADFIDDISTTEKGLQLNELPVIPKSKLLQEVIIKTGSPIRIKGDTVFYTADSFKVGANANVEELLKKLPGIQVGKNGEIKAMGEKVEKVLVDGEEFFGDDPGMTIKNLRADAVKEVQVFDKKSEQSEFTGIDDGKTKKTINLKLKDDKKQGYFGKIEAAGGLMKKIDNRYNTNLLFNAFKGKRKISGYLLQGNTGQNGLNWRDQQKFGGDDDNITMGLDDDGGGFMFISQGSDEDPYIDTRNGFFENLNAGLQYSNKWNEKQTLNFSPKFNRLQYNNVKNTFSQFQLGDSVFNNNAAETNFVTKRSVKNNLVFDYKIDSFNSIKITTKFNLYHVESKTSRHSDNTSKTGIYNNISDNLTDNTTDKNSFTNSVLFKHKFKKDRRTFSLKTDYNLLKTESEGYLKAVNQLFSEGFVNRIDTIDQKKNNNTTNTNLQAKAIYTEPISKNYSLELNYELSWLGGKNNLVTLSKLVPNSTKYDKQVDSLSNNFDQNITTNKTGFKISYKNKKIKYSFGSAVGFTRFNLKDISLNKEYPRNFTNLYPAANFQYTYKPNHSFNFGYNGNTIQPTLNQQQQLRNNNNTLSEYIGNPLLKQSFRHNIDVSHNAYDFLKDMWSYQSININLTNNAITNSTIIDSTGKTITQPINTNGNISISSWSGIGKKMKKLDMYLNMNLQFNYSKFTELVNKNQNNNENTNAVFSIGMSKSKEKKYDISINNDFGYNINRASIFNRIVKYSTNSINCSGSVYYKKVWKLSSDFEFNYRQKTPDFTANVNNKLWNATLERTFHNDEFTLFGTIKDILNQNVGIDRSLYGNTLTEIRNQRLQRFWMIGFRWDFKNKGAATK